MLSWPNTCLMAFVARLQATQQPVDEALRRGKIRLFQGGRAMGEGSDLEGGSDGSDGEDSEEEESGDGLSGSDEGEEDEDEEEDEEEDAGKEALKRQGDVSNGGRWELAQSPGIRSLVGSVPRWVLEWVNQLAGDPVMAELQVGITNLSHTLLQGRRVAVAHAVGFLGDSCERLPVTGICPSRRHVPAWRASAMTERNAHVPQPAVDDGSTCIGCFGLSGQV